MDKKEPHNCNGQFRKNNIKWESLKVEYVSHEHLLESISDKCKRTYQQCCHICEDANCGDNMTPSILKLKQKLKELKQ